MMLRTNFNLNGDAYNWLQCGFGRIKVTKTCNKDNSLQGSTSFHFPSFQLAKSRNLRGQALGSYTTSTTQTEKEKLSPI